MTRSYFPRFRDYRGGTDADHVPVIPGNAYPSDTSSPDEFPLDLAAHGDADMGQPHSASSPRLEMGDVLQSRVKPHNSRPNKQHSLDQVRTNERDCPMKTLIEKDSPLIPLLFIAAIFLIFLGGGLGLAYMGGVFTGKNEVIANDKRIAAEADLTSPAR